VDGGLNVMRGGPTEPLERTPTHLEEATNQTPHGPFETLNCLLMTCLDCVVKNMTYDDDRRGVVIIYK